MTLLQDMRAAMPGLRDSLPDMRETIPDLREWSPNVSDLRDAMPDLRGVLPEAREVLPAIRDSLSDLRADLPGPWRRERPSLIRRIAIVLVAGVVIATATWLLMAFVERRRLSRMTAMEIDETAIERAEGEGMGTAVVGSPVMSPAGTNQPGLNPTESASAAHSPQAPTVRPSIDMDAIRPLVGARTNPSDGGTTDGR